MANNPRRRSWFSTKLPLSFLGGGKSTRPAQATRQTRLSFQTLEDRTVPTISLLDTPTWIEQGPGPINNGQIVGMASQNRPVVGAIQALALHPTNANIAFAGSTNGGIWRSLDAKNLSPTWTPLTDSLPSLSIQDMEFNPNNPNTLLASMGSTDSGGFDYRGSPRGDLLGLYYTKNALDTVNPVQWRILSNNIANQDISGVAARDTYLLIGGDRGIFRSTDDGATFTNITNGIGAVKIFDMIGDPGNADRFYAITNAGVFRSVNGGVAWTNVTAAANGFGVSPLVAAKLTVHSSSFFNVVYSAIAYNTGEMAIAWSTNLGASWTAMDAPKQLSDPRLIAALPNPAPANPNDFAQITSGGVVRLGSNTLGNATNSDGIVYAANRHGLRTGDFVRITGIQRAVDPANPAAGLVDNNFQANGDWQVTVIDAGSFQLNGFTGGTAYVNDAAASQASWQKWLPANPGGQAGIHFNFVADNYNPNVIYLGGDRLDTVLTPSGFWTAAGGAAFTSNILRGDRSNPLASNVPAASRYVAMHKPYNPNNTRDVGGANRPFPQWQPITDNNGGTAPASPHADTRILKMDAEGQLVIGGDGGAYKFSTPNTVTTPLGAIEDTNPTTYTAGPGIAQFSPGVAGATWTSWNAGLFVGTIYSTAYDSNSGIVFAGFQDNGTAEQLSTGNTTWRSRQGGDGFFTAIDTTTLAAQGRSIRYSQSNTMTTIIQTVYDAANNLISTRTLPLNGQTPPPNLTVHPDRTATSYNPIALNKVNPMLFMVGRTGLWEDANVTPGVLTTIGDTVVNVAPPGSTNDPNARITSIVYGGFRPDTVAPFNLLPFTRVAWFGTNTGEVWVRGEAPTDVFQQVFTPDYPKTVSDIVVDPADWRRAYIVRDNSVLFTTDAGQNWTDITDNLYAPTITPNNLTTEIRSLTLWDPTPTVPGDGVLIVGGRGGAFRRDVTLPVGGANWSNYGPNLPNAIVQDLQIYGNRLLAGTYGRGAWMIPDVSTTITLPGELRLTGTPGNDIFIVKQDADNPLLINVSDDGGNTFQSFDKTTFRKLSIFGLGGADTIYIDSNGVPGLNAGLPGQPGLPGGDSDFVKFELYLDGGGDVGDQVIIENGLNAPASQTTITATTIDATATDNLFGIGGFVTYTGFQNGLFTINEGIGANTTIVTGATMGNLIINSQDSGDFLTVTGNNSNLTFNAAGGNEFYQINGNSGTITINTGTGTETLAIQATAGTVNYNGSPGNDTVFISANAQASLPVTLNGSLAGVQGLVTVNGNGGTDVLNVSDFGSTGAGVLPGFLSGTNITGFGMAMGIAYSNWTLLNLTTSNDAATGDTLTVTGTGNALTTNVFQGDGNDTLNIRATATTRPLNGNQGNGDDTLNVSSDAGTNTGNLAGIQGVVVVDAAGGVNSVFFSDLGAVGSTGFLNNNLLTGFGMIAGGVTFNSFTNLALDTSNNAATGDSLTVIDTLPGTNITIRLNDGPDAATVQNNRAATVILGGLGADSILVQANAGSITVDGEAGNDLLALRANALGAVAIIRGGTEDDTIYVSSTATVGSIGAAGTLAGLLGTQSIDGGAGVNTLNISNLGGAAGTGALSPTTLTGFGTSATGLGYLNVAALNFDGSDIAADTLTVTDTIAGTTTIRTNGGGDIVNIQRVTGPISVNTGLGNDTVNVSSDAALNTGVLGFVDGATSLDGGAGVNTLNVSDFGAGTSTGTIGNGTITGFGMAVGINHVNFTPVNITLGGTGPNIITVVGTTPGITTTLNGSGGDDIFNVQATNATGNLVINGLGGNDTVNVSSDAPANTGNLAGIQGAVSFDGGVGSNILNVSDIGNLGTSVGTVNGGTITGFGMGAGGVTATANVQFINIDSSNNQLNGDQITVVNTFATGLTTLRLNGGNDAVTIQNSSGNFNVLGGDGNDIIAIQRNTAGTITAGGGLGNDTFNVSGTATAAGVGTNGLLSGIAAPVVLNGDQGTNTINVSDLGNLTGSVGTLNAGSVTGFGITGTGIAYSNFATFNFDSSNVAGAADVVTIAGTMAGTNFVRLNDGNDTANVRGVTGPLQLNAGAGNDTVNVASAANILTGIQGLFNVDGGTGSNTLNASNFGATTNLSGNLTSTDITGFGMVATGIAFSNIAVLGFDGSNTGNDILTVASTIAGTTTVLGNGGNDTMTLQGDGLGGVNTFDGGLGDDLFTLNAGVGVTGQVQIIGGGNTAAGRDRAVFNGRAGANDAFALTLGTANSTLTGIGSSIGFNTIEGVTVDGLSGTDSFVLGDATNTTYGTALAPVTGVVYRPTGANAGDVRFNMNASTGVSNTLSVTPDINFRNIPGSFFYNGDVDGSGDRDVLTVLGVSQNGNISTGVWNETTAANGVDTITAADNLVTINNPSLGVLHGIGLLPASVSALFVRAGNEAGAAGDNVTATPTTKLLLYIDGQSPAFTTPGDRISVPTLGTSTNSQVTDPNLGAPHRRITDGATGGSVDFINFETLNNGTPASSPAVFAVGSAAGVPGRVRVFDAVTGALKTELNPYPGFTGGIRVAVGDVDGDGIQDIITATGPGGGPHVKVFSGANNAEIRSFFAYASNMNLGVDVAAYDLNLDGKAEIITTVGPGGGPHVRVFDGGNLTELRSFFAYGAGFTGGVSVAAGDIDGDGLPDIVTAPLSGGGPHIIARRFSDMAVVRSFFAFDPSFNGGLNVAVGDINGDFIADIVVGTNGGSAALVTAFDTKVAAERIAFFFADTGSSTQGSQIQLEPSVRPAVTDVNGDGVNEILVARGAGTFPRVRSFRVNPGSLAGVQGTGFEAFEPSFGFGVYIGAK